jgi:transcription elongation GreA/GreB family factor
MDNNSLIASAECLVQVRRNVKHDALKTYNYTRDHSDDLDDDSVDEALTALTHAITQLEHAEANLKLLQHPAPLHRVNPESPAVDNSAEKATHAEHVRGMRSANRLERMTGNNAIDPHV